MIAHTFRGPHSIYRRYQGMLEGSLTSVAFAVMVTYALDTLSVYPTNWVVVMGVAMAILGVRWPAIAYVLAVVALIYPIYTINFYLAVLFVAVSALGHRLFIHYLGATTLVLSTPLLAPGFTSRILSFSNNAFISASKFNFYIFWFVPGPGEPKVVRF